ncbi:MAG TPA: 50S ribosomal protein L3 [Candidatus Saccharimonadia bacterium]|nr:50S ribosomal protein L3 [Candidatus Saccharimonadia bacterium]
MKSLIARKVGMTSTIAEDGSVEGVTLLSAKDNTISQIKTIEIDGYSAIQLSSETSKKIKKPQIKHFSKSKISPKLSREFRINPESIEGYKLGDVLTTESFEIGDLVNVTSTSKGKGYAGTIKRHNFKRGRKTHGGRSYRRPGSIGSMFPQKVFKGKKMAGRMGADQVTVKNLKVTVIDKELGLIGVKGAVPGPRKAIVIIRGTK